MTSRSTHTLGVWRRTRVARRLAALAVVAGIVLLLGIASRGLPQPWVAWISHSLSTDDYRFDVEDVTFSLRRGFRMGVLRMSPAGTEGSPMLTLEHADLKLRWYPGMPSLGWIRELVVHRAVFVSLAAERLGGEVAVLPAFGPLAVRCQHAEVFGVPFRNLQAVLSCTGPRLEIERIHCDLSPPRYPAEAVSGEFSFGTEDRSVRGAVNGELNPVRLAPLLRAIGLRDVPDVIERFAFPADPVKIRLRLEYAPELAIRRVEVVLSAGSCLYRSVPFMAAQATLTAEGGEAWSSFRVDHLTVERPEGTGRGTLLFDLIGEGVEFSGTSTLEPEPLCRMLNLFPNMAWDAWKFGHSAEVSASGYYAFRSSERPTAIEGKARFPTLLWKTFRVRAAELEFAKQPRSLRIPRATARLHGGEIEASGELTWAGGGATNFSLRTDLQKVPFGALVAAVADGRAAEDPGLVNGHLELRGSLGDALLHSLQGDGSVRIREAALYRVPLFAGFTDFMARNVPGVDFVLRQNDLDADFKVRDFAMNFTRLRIEGTLFSINGQGNYWFSDHLDIGIRVNLLKQHTWLGRVLKVALFPVSKLFELELTGPIRAARWTPTTLALRGRREPTEEQRGSRDAPAAEPGPADGEP